MNNKFVVDFSFWLIIIILIMIIIRIGIIFAIIGGVCFTIGVILFLVWKDSKPKTAKAAGIGALVSVGFAILWYIFILAVGIGVSM